MSSFSIFRFNRFSRIAAVAFVLGLGASGPAMATDMICGNVGSMESSISGTFCCQNQGLCNFFGVSTTHCALASGPLQACCDDPSDTEGEQTTCLCGEVDGFSDTQLGFTPEGC